MASSEEEDRGVTARPRAADDWPRGFDWASWWPLLTGIGIIGSYLGFGMYLVGRGAGETPTDPQLGVAVSLVGAIVAVAGVSGWVYQGFIADYWTKSDERNLDRHLWGMLLYFPVELALFGAGFLYFAFIYLGSWPPGDLPPVFTPVIWFMTAVLLVSSFTVYFAGRELRKENERRFLALLAVTPLLGGLFLAGKALNYQRLVLREGLGLSDGIFWTAFFSLDGLHGLLVAVGVAMLLVVLVRARRGHYTSDRHVSLTTTAMYWWMLEAMWLLLVVEVYATAHLCRAGVTC